MAEHQIISPFLNPHELKAFLHDVNTKTKEHYDNNDEILHILIRLYRQSKNKTLASYLLILFQPALMKIYHLYQKRCKSFYDLKEMDIWGHIIESFLSVLNQDDLDHIRQKISIKILGRVKNKMRDWYVTRFGNFSLDMDPYKDIEDILDPLSSKAISILVLNMLFNKLLKTGVITEKDKEIILATRIEGKTLVEASKEFNLRPDTIRQRRYRAEKAIQDYLKPKNSKDIKNHFKK